jgi:hypothetical protein
MRPQHNQLRAEMLATPIHNLMSDCWASAARTDKLRWVGTAAGRKMTAAAGLPAAAASRVDLANRDCSIIVVIIPTILTALVSEKWWQMARKWIQQTMAAKKSY